MKIDKNFFIDNFKTIFYALIIAILIRSIIIQPFYIPSSSMEPNLLVGDRLFVSKYSYGYSKHSFPFSPPIFNGRLFSDTPKRGDVVVFKTPTDNRTDFIKRLIGLPGDLIQFIDGDLYINNNQVLKTKISSNDIIYCPGPDSNVRGEIDVITFNEKLSNGKIHKSVYKKFGSYQDSDKFIVPEKHYFFLGDNRDNSADSRYFARGPGYIKKVDLVGKAQIIFFSNNKEKSPFYKFWEWKKSLRTSRFFKRIE